MTRNRVLKPTLLALLRFGVLGLAAGSAVLPLSAPAQQSRDQAASQGQPEAELVIDTESDLPDTVPHKNYMTRLVVHGGDPPFRWHLEKGSLPPGIKLDDSGTLHGAAERGGEFQFTASVTDSNAHRLQKQFTIRVRSALNVMWKSPPRVNGNRIDGSVEVSNTSPDDMDLTFYVLAVAGDGRATAIGYQHLPLPAGTTDMELPFGETLPRGGYVVHADVVGEVAEKNLIYREHMQTSGPMHITVGP